MSDTPTPIAGLGPDGSAVPPEGAVQGDPSAAQEPGAVTGDQQTVQTPKDGGGPDASATGVVDTDEVGTGGEYVHPEPVSHGLIVQDNVTTPGVQTTRAPSQDADGSIAMVESSHGEPVEAADEHGDAIDAESREVAPST